jgi:hypothetical protein
MLGPIVFNLTYPKPKKIQIIGIQFKVDLNEQNIIWLLDEMHEYIYTSSVFKLFSSFSFKFRVLL